MKKGFSFISVFVLLITAIVLAGCSSSYNAGRQSVQKEVAVPYGSTEAAKNITTAKGYQTTEEDAIKFGNDVYSFLQANVPGFSRYRAALILIDDVEADRLSDVALSDVRQISVLEGSAAVMYGTVAHDGVIIIKTK